MRLNWQPRALKDFDRLDARTRQRVSAALERLAETRHGDVKKMADIRPAEYRLRVGDVRVRFTRDDAAGVLIILRVLPCGEAYR